MVHTPVPANVPSPKRSTLTVSAASSVLKGPLNKLHVLGKIGSLKITVNGVLGLWNCLP